MIATSASVTFMNWVIPPTSFYQDASDYEIWVNYNGTKFIFFNNGSSVIYAPDLLYNNSAYDNATSWSMKNVDPNGRTKI